MRLKEKVAVITGAGSGMGRSIASLFATEGAKVVAADVNVAGGEETVALIRKNGGSAEFIPVDVSLSAEVANLVGATQKKFGKIDIVVNCAGIFMKSTPVEDIDESLWDRVYAVNVKGIMLTTKYVVPLMKEAGGGVIINIASSVGLRPAPFSATYASSKGAVITLTKALALELARAKIRVNYINPGFTDTPMAALFSDEERKMIVNGIPLGRIIKPEDVASAALFLASDESAMLTGTNISVDGGLSI